MHKRTVRLAAVLGTVASLLFSGCSAPITQDGALRVVTSTPVLADLASRVAGDRAQVSSLIPSGADPHTYEPKLRDIRDVSYANVAFTNGLLLEQDKLLKTVTSNLPSDSRYVSVGEHLEQYGGKLEPLVEDASLDSIWLGLRVEGTASESTRFSAVRVQGPGQLAAFITQTFGAVEKVADSKADGAQTREQQTEQDGVVQVAEGNLGGTGLPAQAHTHLSWAFTRPGHYELTVKADAPEGARDVAPTTLHFAVGQDPQPLADRLCGARILSAGHADITANLETGRLSLRSDTGEKPEYLDPAHTVIAVPSRVLQELPSGSSYRFLGKPGDKVYLLAQAVLGKHIHGDVDPHYLQSVPNAIAAVKLMQDTLAQADPAGAATYSQNANALVQQLTALDQELTETYGKLPPPAKNLITTHDGFRYLATSYKLTVAGYVSAAPGSEPSLFQRERLHQTIQDLGMKALYTERNTAQRLPILQEIARDSQVQVCELYTDTLDAAAPHYEDTMRANAATISRCTQ